MFASLSPDRLAALAVRRPWFVVATWLVLIAGAVVAASSMGDVLTTSASNYVASESSDADNLIKERLQGEVPGEEVVVIQSADKTVDAPEFQALVTRVTEELRAHPDSVKSVTNTFETGAPAMISADRRTTIIPVTLQGIRIEAQDYVEPIIEITSALDGVNGFTVVTSGDGSAALGFTEQAEKDLQTAEIIGMPVAIVILVLVFGALVAAGLPIFLGLLAIVIALGISSILGRQFELSIFLVNFVTTMGLAVGIDYSLIIVQRVREERRNGLSVDEAIIRAGSTASRAVLFSGMTVVVALFGLVIVPTSIFRSLGVGAILVVAVAVMLALTLLPAVLKLLGDKVNGISLHIPGFMRRKTPSNVSFWDRVTHAVMARPVVSVVASVTLLVLASLPYFTIQLGWAGVSTLPADSEARRGFTILNSEFSAGLVSPTRIVIDAQDVNAPAVTESTAKLIERLKADGRFGEAAIETNAAGNLSLITTAIQGDPQSDLAIDAISDLRDVIIPAAFSGSGAEVLVSGGTALGMDDTALIDRYTIPVFVFVLGLSFLILLVVFRSIVVPVKAMIMNLLSVGAAYGLMVLIFQHGVGNELLGFTQTETIEAWVPLFMFATIFGLSMDYHVFLLTRIREHFDHTGNNTESVAYGVRTTAGMITGAAAIMVAVFAGFASGEMVMFQQMGFGLATAVILDATIVRIVLVPASMQLLGARNWYLPSWLEWLPRVNVEGTPAPAPKPAAVPAGIPAPAYALDLDGSVGE